MDDLISRQAAIDALQGREVNRMTKAEAIAMLKRIQEPEAWEPQINQAAFEALDMAIKALEQQPCEDTISRADVEQTVEDNILCYTHSDRPIDQDPDTECDMAIRMALRMLRKDLRKLPSVTSRSLNPEADREESKAYCAECDHIEMCSWYPHDGCEWLKTDRYNAGYNAAKREIALSGEYERAYERGKADAHPDINDGKLSEIPTGSEREE